MNHRPGSKSNRPHLNPSSSSSSSSSSNKNPYLNCQLCGGKGHLAKDCKRSRNHYSSSSRKDKDRERERDRDRYRREDRDKDKGRIDLTKRESSPKSGSKDRKSEELHRQRSSSRESNSSNKDKLNVKGEITGLFKFLSLFIEFS